jgi:hypothetical protein
MNVTFPRSRVKRMGPGVKSVQVPRLHIGWNEDDARMWGDLPFRGEDGGLAYGGGAVIVINESPDVIRISIIKSHTGIDYSDVGEVRVIDGSHATEIIVENPVRPSS